MGDVDGFGVWAPRAAHCHSSPPEQSHGHLSVFLLGQEAAHIPWHWLFMKLSLLCIHPRFNTSPAVPWLSISFLITRPEEMIWVSIITCLYARAGHYPHCLLMAVSWLNVHQLWGFPTQMLSSHFRFFSWTKPQLSLITLTPSLSHTWTDPKASQDLLVLQQLLWKREIKKVSQTTEAFPVSHFHLFIHPTTAVSYLTAGERNF